MFTIPLLKLALLGVLATVIGIGLRFLWAYLKKHQVRLLRLHWRPRNIGIIAFVACLILEGLWWNLPLPFVGDSIAEFFHDLYSRLAEPIISNVNEQAELIQSDLSAASPVIDEPTDRVVAVTVAAVLFCAKFFMIALLAVLMLKADAAVKAILAKANQDEASQDSGVKKDRDDSLATVAEAKKTEMKAEAKKRNWGIISSVWKTGATTGDAAKYVGGSVSKVGRIRNFFRRRKS